MPPKIILSVLSGLAFALATLGIGGDANASGNNQREMTRALKKLHTHEEIIEVLSTLQKRAKTPMQVGPLIDNGYNDGLFNIDIAMDAGLPVNQDVCGMGGTPTIREAVTCTVPVGERGNRDPGLVGYSTQGRELWAVRMGNPFGRRVAFWTQQHGNEVASTEAALKIIKTLSKARKRWVRAALSELDILIVVRANPDGGEVGPDCFLPPYAIGSTVGNGSCGLTRYTVDPNAGGGFLSDSEPGFFGVVGRGYDMNRYHHPDLSEAIRPQEVQALVAATLVFQPDNLIDLHGDIGKATCDIDTGTIVPNPLLGGLPSAECIVDDDHDVIGPVPADEIVAFSMAAGNAPDGSVEQRQRRALGFKIISAVERKRLGKGVRFTQVAVGAGIVPDAFPYDSLGVQHQVWESRTISSVGLAVSAVTAGVPTVGLVPDTGFDPSILQRGIRVNKIALRESLKTLTKFAASTPDNDGGYCDIPVASGLVIKLPEFYFGPNPYTESPIFAPLLPGVVPFSYFDDCQ